MTVRNKIKTINNKIKQIKSPYSLDKQTAKISALSSKNVGKYLFLSGKDVILEKYLFEKTSTISRFEYLLLGSEKQTDITEGQHKFFKHQINVNNNNREEDESVEDKSGKSRRFDAILKDMNNKGKTTKSKYHIH